MGKEDNQPVPVPSGIKLHRKSRYLEIIYPDGEIFKLPNEYLRAFLPGTKKKAARPVGDLEIGRKDVNISAINPVGTYAIQIIFAEGQETGIYSWARLYDMAINLKVNWEDRRSSKKGTATEKEAKRTITILYFASLVNRLGLESEIITLPGDIESIDDLVPWLMTRRGEWKRALSGTLKIKRNRRFSGMIDLIDDGDEISLELVEE